MASTCIAVVLAATAFRLWGIQGAWFFYDDFWYIQHARSNDLTLGYLLTDYNGHLMPGGMLLNWLNAGVQPLGFTLPAIELIVGFAVAGLGMVKLLLRLFGHRWGVLVPLALFLLSPILLPATTWWAAGVNQVPLLISMTFGLDAFVGYLQKPSRRLLTLHLLWLVFGLLFSERTLLVVVLGWLIAVIWFTCGSGPERLRSLWRDHRVALIAQGVLMAAYLAAYVPLALNFDAATVAKRPFFAIVQDMALTAFSAGLVGGPLNWKTTEVTQQEAHPSPWFLLASQIVLVGLVVVSARTRRRGLRAWSLPAAVLAINVALVATSRAIYFGPEIALDYRFQTEAALAAAVAIAGAFMPVRHALEPSIPREGAVRLDKPVWVAPALIVFVVLATVTTSRFPLRDLGTISPRAYLETVATEAKAHPGAVLLNCPTPSWFWAPLAYPTNTYEYMFREIPGVEVDTVVTGQPFLVDEGGHYRALGLTPVRELATPLPDTECPARLGRGESEWPLNGPVYGVGWFVLLTYAADDGDGTVKVTTGGRASTAPLVEGVNRVLVPATGAFDTVTLRPSTSASRVCLRGLQLVGLDAP